MRLIIGLGNPGKKYENTRHNFGFMVLDELSSELNINFTSGKGNYYIGKGIYQSEKILLVKPTTYMNNSGFAVKDLVQYYKIHFSELIVIVDDFNLNIGVIRLRQKGSAGGNKGLKSIIDLLCTNEFPRLRLGTNNGYIGNHVDFVLSKFLESEKESVRKVIEISLNAIYLWLSEDITAAMDKYNNAQIITELINSKN